MAKQKAPDGTEYEYDPNDPADVMRVAVLCEPSDEEKRKRAKAAFEAAAPEAAKAAAAGVALGAGGFSSVDMNEMIKNAIRDALAGQKAQAADVKPVDTGDAALGATSPVPLATTPVEGSQG